MSDHNAPIFEEVRRLLPHVDFQHVELTPPEPATPPSSEPESQ
ncbi:hypothetical protein [Actinophytocola oryzae]|uniref:Uncharacterized protein n=1 Tax=Actinophytocola oryzae TaxID=502181 RepID=A0A4R7VQ77_9PSEU|nr:hypothetical protein [Actinophytocola oryzae]TDV51890.1 hypothetical protein CLV71_10519 [Actinophytocola oryzae]